MIAQGGPLQGLGWLKEPTCSRAGAAAVPAALPTAERVRFTRARTARPGSKIFRILHPVTRSSDDEMATL